jgi:MFS family permease
VLLFALGFYALLLGNVLFLTRVWGYSVLEAGFALTPGPLLAAVTAPVGGRLADRYGQRVVALPGGLLFAVGCLMFAAHAQGRPDYAASFLPWMALTGSGVGLSFAAWSSAAVAELPPSRYATGSALSACSRQIGAVLGIAVLIAVIGAPARGEALATFHRAWFLMAIPAFGAAALALGLGRVRARDPEAVTVAA